MLPPLLDDDDRLTGRPPSSSSFQATPMANFRRLISAVKGDLEASDLIIERSRDGLHSRQVPLLLASEILSGYVTA